MREVTERDIRRPEFADAKLEDLEFDGTGEVVRKDRWETAVRSIVGMLEDQGYAGVRRRSFSIPQVLSSLRKIFRNKQGDLPVPPVELARRILTWQGRSISPSLEPGADSEVDRLAAFLEPLLVACATPGDDE